MFEFLTSHNKLRILYDSICYYKHVVENRWFLKKIKKCTNLVKFYLLIVFITLIVLGVLIVVDIVVAITDDTEVFVILWTPKGSNGSIFPSTFFRTYVSGNKPTLSLIWPYNQPGPTLVGAFTKT